MQDASACARVGDSLLKRKEKGEEALDDFRHFTTFYYLETAS